MDAVNLTLNDMSMSQELLNQYSDHAKSILPGFASNNTSTPPQQNRVQFQEDVDTYSQIRDGNNQQQMKSLHDMSPEEQMILMRKIQNNEISKELNNNRQQSEIQQVENIDYSDNETVTSYNEKMDTGMERQGDKFVMPNENSFLYYKLKIILIILVLFFIVNLHKANFYISKALLFLTGIKNNYALAAIKSALFTGILCIPILLLS